jgi:hypothetical protein
MAPSRPLPMGKASVHFWAGLLYQSLSWLEVSFAEMKIEQIRNRNKKSRVGFVFIGHRF